MTNAWQLYKRGSKEMPGTCTGTTDPLIFTYHVSDSLYLLNKPIATSISHSRAYSPTPPPQTSRRLGTRPTDVSREVANYQTSHWPEITQTRRRCRLCCKLARLKFAPLKTEKELKRAGRGAFHVCTTAESTLCIVRLHDSAVVDLSSTYVCTQPVCKVKRWNKKQKTLVDLSCPAIVKEYNKYMGGVDLARVLRALYRIDHRSRKWYRRIFLDTPRGSSERMAAVQKRP
ncbi:PiggyBac transposable element-derived protein 3 [Trichinella britovi]|uniref:PiggyBac transposable element-derived protein 3 n=1 Tax=Trichinella britovi TaxID=45882 RepID=A0A0V1C702_TRIBR|nr:PiggyBac transposable element-derived protein 3 [Trichinella britovi]